MNSVVVASPVIPAAVPYQAITNRKPHRRLFGEFLNNRAAGWTGGAAELQKRFEMHRKAFSQESRLTSAEVGNWRR